MGRNKDNEDIQHVLPAMLNQMLGFPQAMVFPGDDQDKLVCDPVCGFQKGKK
jgi:hypothetical protein